LGQELTFSLEDGAKVIDPNGRESNIVAVDIEAQNGVVHVIDTVILSDLRPATVVDIATSNDDFSILVAALTREDLTIDFVSALTGEGPFTVFAPTNAAFVALLNELGATSLDDIDTGTLEAVLQMHVLAGKVMSADLSEGLTAETLLGQKLIFSLEDGAKIIDPNGRVSNITAVDIEAQNGVVHVIDTVILSDLRPATVVDIAASNDDFSILVAALTREDLTIDFVGALTGEGPFTVFAPTNAAFVALLNELGATSLDDIDTGTLEAVLQMHVLAGKVMSADLSEGLMAETLLGQELTFSLEDGAEVIDPNGRVSNIVAVDIEAQNGVVHVIDTVILSDLRPATVVDIATGNDDFSILVAALTREDLTIDFVGALTGEGPFTVFAPTNVAFAALLNELGATSLDDIDTGTLEAVLQMHVLAGKVMSTDLSEGLTAETLLGQELTFSLEGGAKIIDPNGRVSNIVAVDIEAQNGVVHVIDTVILLDLTPTNVKKLEEITFDFYPNPANGYITVRTDEIGSTLRIIDISGKMMRVEKVVNTSQRIDLNGLNAGVYFISVESEAKRITQKLIVR
jgi:transforming growth factor-beta-induced protein